MYNDEWRPDVVVGIDFGMTCTGIAWSRGPEWHEPKPFQHWPGKMISELANKVPTTLQYALSSTSVQSWGFTCEQDTEEAEIVDCFKLHLDPAFRDDPRPDRPSVEQARTWYQDYLRCIHDHIAEVLSNIVPRWTAHRVEFVFSVPTTWKNPHMIAEMEKIIRYAGFGADSDGHRATISLTEAEAAAVYASKQQFEAGDVILVCDAGGGTTDINTLRVMSPQGTPICLEPLSWVEGRPLGSIAIDSAFHALAVNRLRRIQDQIEGDPRTIADRMMRKGGIFERFKCSFGSALWNVMPALPLKIPEMRDGLNYPEALIENSSMIFSRDDLKAIFDVQVNKLLDLLNEQFGRISQQNQDVKVSHLVLAGGLGSSLYIKERLRAYFASGPGAFCRAVETMTVASVEEPQLAVALGLVIDRVQSIRLGVETFSKRCCRLSYGVICREEYRPNSNRHLGQPVIKDRREGKTWVDGQIRWFIEQGQLVDLHGVAKPFSVLKTPGDEFQPWITQIVMSSAPREHLPTNIRQDGVRPLCDVSSVLKKQEVDMKLKNRHWYNRGKKYWRFRFNVKAVVGAADLKFLLLTKDNKVISDDHNAIEIIWQTGTDSFGNEKNSAVVIAAPDAELQA